MDELKPLMPPKISLRGPEPDKLPEGWWRLSGVRGTREGVIKLVKSAPGVPPHAVDYLLAEIAAIDGRFNFVALDAHSHLHGGQRVLHLSIVPSTVAMG